MPPDRLTRPRGITDIYAYSVLRRFSPLGRSRRELGAREYTHAYRHGTTGRKIRKTLSAVRGLNFEKCARTRTILDQVGLGSGNFSFKTIGNLLRSRFYVLGKTVA